MLIKKENKQESNGKTDINSSVTKRNQNKRGIQNQKEDKFYFDISGDNINLKKSFLFNNKVPLNKKKTKKYFEQNNKNTATENKGYKSVNSSASTETNSNSDPVKKIRKDKNVYIKFKYNDNYGSFLGLHNKSKNKSISDSGIGKDIPFLQRKVNNIKEVDTSHNHQKQIESKSDFPSLSIDFKNKNTFPMKKLSKNVTTNLKERLIKNRTESCPSICGSTDEEITNDEVNFSNLNDIPNFNNGEIIKVNNFKIPGKHKKFNTISTNNWFQTGPVNVIDIRDSDCEMSTFRKPKKFKKNNIDKGNSKIIESENYDKNTQLSRNKNVDPNNSKSKKRKRISSVSNGNSSNSLEDVVDKKRLKFVNIEDSDCAMSLYSKTKKKIDLKKKKHRDKKNKITNDVYKDNLLVLNNPKKSKKHKTSDKNFILKDNNSKIFLRLERNKEIETNNKNNGSLNSIKNSTTCINGENPIEHRKKINFVDIRKKEEISLLTKIKKKKKITKENYSNNRFLDEISQENCDSVNKKLALRKSILAHDIKNMNINDSIGHHTISEKLNFVGINSDCEISILSKMKKKKHKTDRMADNNEINQSQNVTELELEKEFVAHNEKNNDRKDASKNTNVNNKNNKNTVKGDTTYDFKFNNFEEIRKDLDISGISFEEDLSVIEQNKSPCFEFTNEHKDNKYEDDKLNLTGKYEIISDIHKFEENHNEKKDIKMPDLDVTRLSVLVDLKSVKECNRLRKSSKSPRKMSTPGNTENRVVIKVSYSDSHKHKKNWNIGIRNIEGLANSCVNAETNEKYFNSEDNIDTAIKQENIDESNNNKKTDINTKIIEEKPVNMKNCESQYDTTNIIVTPGELENPMEVVETSSNIECKTCIEGVTDSEFSSEVQHNELDDDDDDDVFKDELKSENVTAENLESLAGSLESSSDDDFGKNKSDLQHPESLQEISNNEFGHGDNEDVSKDDKKNKEASADSLFRKCLMSDHSQLDQIEESGRETFTSESLKPIQNISLSSNFDDINLIDENSTLQNINIEELKQTFEENSLEIKHVINFNSTENLLIVPQTESDNENNLNSMLIFEDLNSTALTSSQDKEKSLSKINDQIIMDLEVFMDLQNVEELFNNLSEKDKEEDDTNNITDICQSYPFSIEKSNVIENGGKAMRSETENYISDTKGDEEISANKTIKHSDSDNDSDCSNYSDELRSTSSKGKLRNRKLLNSTRSEIKNQNKNSNQVKNEDTKDVHSDDDETRDSKWFLDKISHISVDSDFFDDTDDENDLNITNEQQQLDPPSISYDERNENRSALDKSSTNDSYRPVTTEDIENIKNLRIKLSFTPSQLHQTITRSTSPSKDQYDDVRKANIQVKVGTFSSEEDEIIKKNWESFLEEYKLDIPPTAMFKFPSKMKLEQKILFIKYLSRGLDSRWPHTVHERFRNLYLNRKWKLGRYTKKEDKIILNYLAETESKQPYKDLEGILNRPSYSILQRFRYYQKEKIKLTKWNLVTMEKFVKSLMIIAKCKDIEDLRHRKFTEEEWRKLAKRMKNGMTAHHVKYRWKSCIHHRLFSDNVPLPVVKAELLKRLQDAKVTEWKHINWEEIAKDFHGYNSTYLCLAFVQISRGVPLETRKNLQECLSFLRSKFPSETPSHTKSNTSRKLIYKDGGLKYREEP